MAKAKANEEVKELQKLTGLDLVRESAKLDGTEEFLIAIGGVDYKITHDVIFRKTKQQKVLEDMIAFFNEVNSFNLELLEMVTPYTSLLVIKHFTDLDVPDDVEEALELLTALIDLEVLATIINALPEAQVLKVFELLATTIDNIKNNVEEAEAEALAIEALNAVQEDVKAEVEIKKEKLVKADGDKVE